MKATASQKSEVFKPVDLTITFESQEELNEFYAIFNHPWVTHPLPRINWEAILSALKPIDPRIAVHSQDAYGRLHNKLK